MDERRIYNLLGGICAVALSAILLAGLGVQRPRWAVAGAVVVCGAAVFAFRGLNLKGLTNAQALVYVATVSSVIVVWTPFKTAAYLSPLLFLGIIVLGLSVSGNALVLNRLLMIGLVFCAVTFAYGVNHRGFVYQNAIIALLTYSSFIPLIVLPNHWLVKEGVLLRVLPFLAGITLVQACFGMVQFAVGFSRLGGFVGLVGDHVEGTIHPALSPSGAADTAMFAANMGAAVLVLGFAAYRYNRRYGIPAAAGLITLLLTDRVHMVAIFFGAAGLSFLLFRPRLLRTQFSLRVGIIVLLVLAGLTSYLVSRHRVSQTGAQIERLYGGKNEKWALYRLVFADLPRESVSYFLFGFGPGQFNSRAAAISAGYLGNMPPPFSYQPAPPYLEHALPLWYAHFVGSPGGSLDRPASGWCAIPGEFGFPAMAMLLFTLSRLGLKIHRAARSSADRIQGFFLTAGILYYFGIGSMDFYWETCQAIFVGLLLYKLIYANLLYETAPTLYTTAAAAATFLENRPLPALASAR